jgi:FtsH-binding integral membrane protein
MTQSYNARRGIHCNWGTLRHGDAVRVHDGADRSDHMPVHTGRLSRAQPIRRVGPGFLDRIACLPMAMNLTLRHSERLTLGMLFGFGLLVGLATAPTISYIANVYPEAVWEAGGATALFVAGFGAAGYARRGDLSALARVLLWALIAFGILLIFVMIPAGSIIYAVLGLAIFAGLVMYDFQRLRIRNNIDSAPTLAASIFLDILNVVQSFLTLFGRTRR